MTNNAREIQVKGITNEANRVYYMNRNSYNARSLNATVEQKGTSVGHTRLIAKDTLQIMHNQTKTTKKNND